MVTIETREPTEKEKRISELEKQATALSKTDLKKAIECLQEVKRLKPMVGTDYPIKASFRLPKFLCRDGRINEAVAEFEELIKTTPERVERFVFEDNYTPKMYKLMCDSREATDLYLIYAEMSLFYKRLKQTDKEDYYESLAIEYEDKAEKLHEKFAKKRKQRQAQKAKEREQRKFEYEQQKKQEDNLTALVYGVTGVIFLIVMVAIYAMFF